MEDHQAKDGEMNKSMSLPKRAVMAITALISAGLVGTVVVGLSSAAPAVGVTGDPPTISYASISDPPPPSVPSVGADNIGFSELGNEVTLVPPGPLDSVIVTMSTWACQSGLYYDNCQTTPGATFAVPMTLKIYSQGSGTAPGPVIATDAETINIPFRPSPSPECAAELPTGFYDATNKTCHDGKAVNITFSNFTFENGFSAAEPLPATVIYGIAYNTYGHGYHPIGGDPLGPVNYLNIGLSTNVTAGKNASLDSVFMAAEDGNLLTCDPLETGPPPPFRSYNVIAPTESSDCGMGVDYYFPAVIINTTTPAPPTTTTAPTTTPRPRPPHSNGIEPTSTTSPPTTAPPTTVTPPINPPVLPPFPHAGLSYPNAAIVNFGANHYVFAGGRAFQASASELAAVQKVDPAKVVVAEPAGIVPPTSVAPRPGVTVFTQPVNGNVTIYVVGADGELHPFATPTQFLQDGYDGANVITVPNLGGLKVGSNAGKTLTALVTRADGAIVNSSGTLYTFAGGRAFGIPTPAALVEIRKSNSAVELQGSVLLGRHRRPHSRWGRAQCGGPVYVSYVGRLYPFKTTAQLANTGYGGTPAVPAPHTGGLAVVFPYA